MNTINYYLVMVAMETGEQWIHRISFDTMSNIQYQVFKYFISMGISVVLFESERSLPRKYFFHSNQAISLATRHFP